MLVGIPGYLGQQQLSVIKVKNTFTELYVNIFCYMLCYISYFLLIICGKFMLGLLLQILLYISVNFNSCWVYCSKYYCTYLLLLTHVWFTAPNIDCINMDTRLTFYIIPYTNLILLCVYKPQEALI